MRDTQIFLSSCRYFSILSLGAEYKWTGRVCCILLLLSYPDILFSNRHRPHSTPLPCSNDLHYPLPSLFGYCSSCGIHCPTTGERFDCITSGILANSHTDSRCWHCWLQQPCLERLQLRSFWRAALWRIQADGSDGLSYQYGRFRSLQSLG